VNFLIFIWHPNGHVDSTMLNHVEPCWTIESKVVTVEIQAASTGIVQMDHSNRQSTDFYFFQWRTNSIDFGASATL
jgi:hypothetical protein